MYQRFSEDQIKQYKVEGALDTPSLNFLFFCFLMLAPLWGTSKVYLYNDTYFHKLSDVLALQGIRAATLNMELKGKKRGILIASQPFG